jgi:hypothetical protein
MELFVQGFVARILVGLGLNLFLKKPRFIVPHWSVTLITISFYLYTYEISELSPMMVGFISLDLIVPLIKMANKSNDKSKA